MVTDPQTHKQTYRQDRLQYTALLSLAHSVMKDRKYDLMDLEVMWQLFLTTLVQYCLNLGDLLFLKFIIIL